MTILAAYDRFDIAMCSMIALFVAVALYWTNRRPSEFDDEPAPKRVETLMVWVIVGMFAALLATVMARR